MHETGAQWLMTSLEPSPEMVAAVRTCMTIPVFCLALPAGVWADQSDRRKWLISTQLILLIIASSMGVLAAFNMMTPWILLALTAAMGVGMILNQPAWQSLTPELVPPALIPSAVSVGSLSFNLARSLGPAIAGLLMAQVGIWCTFVFNAVSFLAIICVLLAWDPPVEAIHPEEKNDNSTARRKRKKAKPKFLDELRKGIFVIRNSSELRNTLLRLLLFAIPASILWSLLPLIATEKLLFQERGFGLCLGIIGCGAVLGAVIMPWIRTKVSSEGLLLWAQFVFGALCIAIGVSSSRSVILPVLVVIGFCWMTIMTTLNATAQVYLPRKFRARGMAAYIMFFALGMAIGSASWGWLARWSGTSMAYVAAGGLLILVSLALHRLKIGTLKVGENLDSSSQA